MSIEQDADVENAATTEAVIQLVVRRETVFLALWVIGMMLFLIGYAMNILFSPAKSSILDHGLVGVRILGLGSVAVSWLMILVFYRCPACGHHLKWRTRREQIHCPKCGVQLRAEE